MVLAVYKASAGSGKTHKLTEEYLKIVLKNPDNYKRILAITFTNKATAEMKKRILTELFNLSGDGESAHKSNLLKEFKWMDIQSLTERARKVLNNIIYDYAGFNISTIDSFFQKVIRSFSKELGIQYGYNIELDTNSILSKAIDLMLLEIGSNTQLTSWIISFSEERMEEGSTWKLKPEIELLAKELLKESFQQFEPVIRKKLADKDFIKNFQSSLFSIINYYEKGIVEISTQAIELIANSDLISSDFKGGSRSFINCFFKMKNQPVDWYKENLSDYVHSPEMWFAKTSSEEVKTKITTAFHNGLNKLLEEAIEFYNKYVFSYNSAKSVRKYLYVLGILSDISGKLRIIRERDNMLLISDVNLLLNNIIDRNDTPFIFEKTGSRYSYFLLDEFQDTSAYQWDNLRPLIKNSLDSNNFNLVVGDIKQSIYRWRGGDWRLLLHQIYKDIGNQLIESFSLDNNWRSDENIINFNDSLFTQLPHLLQLVINGKMAESGFEPSSENADLLVKAYLDAYQCFPEQRAKHQGFVKAYFFERNSNEKGWKEEVAEKLPVLIDNLIQSGYQEKDIAILVRKASDGVAAANILLKENKYNIISKDSLFLNRSLSVRLIICSLKYIANPDDILNLTELVGLYNQMNQINTNYDLFLSKDKSVSIKELLLNYLPEFFHHPANFKYFTSLFELSEIVIDNLGLNNNKQEYSFIQAFLDVIIDYTGRNSSDLISFLEWWKEHGHEKSLLMPEVVNGIQIITIHKAKGLDFNVVIIPYCDWDLDHSAVHSNILWCKSGISPFDEMDILPLKYASVLEKSIFVEDYFNEKLSSYIDNLNALYVALTRARNGIVLFAPKSKNESYSRIGDLLYYGIKNSSQIAQEASGRNIIKINDLLDETTNEFTLGSFPVKVEKEDKEEGNSYQLDSLIYKKKDFELKTKTDSIGLMNIDESRQGKLNYGKFMHKVLSEIKTIDEVENAVNRLFYEGMIDFAAKNALVDKLNIILNRDIVSDWFLPKWQVKNEIPLLIPGESFKTPDRVIIHENRAIVIDFKFSTISKSHQKQVKDYMILLTEMNYQPVSGFVFYPELGEVIAVE